MAIIREIGLTVNVDPDLLRKMEARDQKRCERLLAIWQQKQSFKPKSKKKAI